MDKAGGMKVFALSFFVGVLCLFYFGFGKTCGIGYEPGVVITPDDTESDDSLPAQSVEPQDFVNTCGATKSQCPSDMAYVQGNFCPNLQEVCIKWLDKPSCGMWGKDKQGKRFCKAMIPPMRCAEFKPTKCLSKPSEIKPMAFCIDKFEGLSKEGEVPQTFISYDQSVVACAAVGKRVCRDTEWTEAARGGSVGGVEQNLPYPTGLKRPTEECNIDNGTWLDPSKHSRDELRKVFRASSSKSLCHPPGLEFYDSIGNVDENVQSTYGTKFKNVLVGGHPLYVRNRSNGVRVKTTSHGPDFSYYDSSTRCCKDL